jgi:hypothetical protein
MPAERKMTNADVILEAEVVTRNTEVEATSVVVLHLLGILLTLQPHLEVVITAKNITKSTSGTNSGQSRVPEIAKRRVGSLLRKMKNEKCRLA